jgi:hypothetical protein
MRVCNCKILIQEFTVCFVVNVRKVRLLTVVQEINSLADTSRGFISERKNDGLLSSTATGGHFGVAKDIEKIVRTGLAVTEKKTMI